jgi:hypothetical protein
VKYDRWQPPFANDPALAALTDEQIDALAEVILSRATPGQVLASGRSSWQPFPREHLRSGDRVKLRATFDRGVPVYLSQTWATVVKVGLTGWWSRRIGTSRRATNAGYGSTTSRSAPSATADEGGGR